MRRFHRYQALGNDYLVVEGTDSEDGSLTADVVRRICDRHFVVGSDGSLLGIAASDGGFGVRILNPDGSEAEKSGNGLRILETHALFPDRTNVQFVKILGRQRIQIEIWERGAGYTLASGSSSCAAAAPVRLGLCAGDVT